MSTHGVAEAKDHLPKLIDRALRGERVVITRRGQPVVELRPIVRPARPVTPADLDALAAWRATLPTMPDNAGALVSTMRDADERRACTSLPVFCWHS